MCRLLEVSRSGYHAWKSRPKSDKVIKNENLLVDIRRVYLENNKNYGSPRICKALRKENITCSENRIARLMRIDGLIAVQRLKFKATTNSKHDFPVAPNLLNRNFITPVPNKVWVSDITYVWTYEGWLYLAFVLDLFCRTIVGFSVSDRLMDELTQSALRQAVLRTNPCSGLIHHSDRGSQYASYDYQNLLKEHGIIPSMSRKGDCWDNAVGESFVHTLKVELVNRFRFRTRQEAKLKIFEYIEMYYNSRRMHSTLGYMSPSEFRKQALAVL